MFSFSKHATEVYQQYLNVLYDVNIPRDWTREQLLNEGQNRCERLGLVPSSGTPAKQRPFPSMDWSKKDKGWTSAFYEFKKLKKKTRVVQVIIGDTFWDSAFLLSDLDNPVIAKVVPVGSLGRINEAKRDLNCLGLPLTKRVAKWICRFSDIIKPTNSLLTTSGLGLMFPIGKNKEGKITWRYAWGVADIGVMYANAELRHSIATKNEVNAPPFSTENLDAIFMNDSPPDKQEFRIEGYMLDRSLNELVKNLNTRNDLSTVQARQAVRKYMEVKKYIWDKEKSYTRYDLKVEQLLEQDVPTIYDEISNDKRTYANLGAYANKIR